MIFKYIQNCFKEICLYGGNRFQFNRKMEEITDIFSFPRTNIEVYLELIFRFCAYWIRRGLKFH